MTMSKVSWRVCSNLISFYLFYVCWLCPNCLALFWILLLSLIFLPLSIQNRSRWDQTVRFQNRVRNDAWRNYSSFFHFSLSSSSFQARFKLVFARMLKKMANLHHHFDMFSVDDMEIIKKHGVTKETHLTTGSDFIVPFFSNKQLAHIGFPITDTHVFARSRLPKPCRSWKDAMGQPILWSCLDEGQEGQWWSGNLHQDKGVPSVDERQVEWVHILLWTLTVQSVSYIRNSLLASNRWNVSSTQEQTLSVAAPNEAAIEEAPGQSLFDDRDKIEDSEADEDD